MAKITVNAVFNGVDAVDLRPDQSKPEFYDGFLGYYSLYEGNAANDLTANVTLTGSNWTVAAMRFGSAGMDEQVHITDANDNAGRRIDLLKLGQNSTVELMSTRVKFMEGGNGALHDVTLGSERTSAVNLYADLNKITTGSGYVAAINTDNDSVIKVNGDVGAILTAEGDDSLTVNSGWVEFFKSRGGDNDVLVQGNGAIGTIDINKGAEVKVTLKDDARVKSLQTNGDAFVEIKDNAKIDNLNLNEGTNTVITGDRWVSTMQSWMAKNTIKIGDGGMGAIELYGDGTLAQKITANGHLGNLGVHDDLKATVKIGAGGAGTIRTDDANDKVTTGSGWVELVATRGGNDKVTIGKGGAGIVRTGDGDDVIKISEIPLDGGFRINGGGGNDTLDFSKFKTSVTFTLNEAGLFQNVGNPENPGEYAVGYFAQGSIENLKGGKKDDALTGDFRDNKLIGGKGNDRLEGGRGDDVLQGDAGKDVFVFGEDDGTDTIKRYSRKDTIEIAEHDGGFKALKISKDSGDLVIEYDGGTIILDGKAGLSLNASDFDFV